MKKGRRKEACFGVGQRSGSREGVGRGSRLQHKVFDHFACSTGGVKKDRVCKKHVLITVLARLLGPERAVSTK